MPSNQNIEHDKGKDSTNEDEIISERVERQIKYCMNIRPDTLGFIQDIQSKLNSIKSDWKIDKTQKVTTDKKKIENVVAEFAADMAKVNSNFQTLLDCLSDIIPRLEQVDLLEKRVSDLEYRLKAKEVVVTSNSTETAKSHHSPFAKEDQSERLSRLEYVASEEEHEKRVTLAVVTHPQLDPNKNDLNKHICDFLRNELRMSEREIDPNLTAIKNGREHTITINFTRKLFKKFLYAARGKLHKTNAEICRDLFINDNLTHYNFSLLRLLKRERRIRNESAMNNFVSVFSLDGKVYAKTSPDANKTYIKNMGAYKKFLLALDENNKEASPIEDTN